MSYIIKLRRGTTAEWTAANPVLAEGELGYEKDTRKLKLGDGVTTYSQLPFYLPSLTTSEFNEAVQDAVASLLAGASGVTLSYNDAANSLTITGGGSGGLDSEAVRDAMGVAMVGAGVISIAVNDAADTITISSSATANSTDAFLRDRANHTGTQAAATISDLPAAITDGINATDMAAKVNGLPVFSNITWIGMGPTLPTDPAIPNNTSLFFKTLS